MRLRDGAAAGDEDRERARRRHARRQPGGLRARRRARCCYEEEERWKEAADELQRALPFDPEAAEVRAHLAELFIRLGRLDDAAEQIARSLQIAPTVEGYLAEAHLAEAYGDEAHRAQAIPALREAARAGARRTTTPRRSSARTWSWPRRRWSRWIWRRRSTPRASWSTPRPRRCAGACSWPSLAWATGALDRGGGGAGRRDRARAQRRRGAHPAGRAAGRDQQDRRRARPASRRDRSRRGADGRSPTRSRAGWCCAATSTEAQELADRLVADAGRRRRAGGGERVRAHRQAARSGASRWPSAPQKLGLAAGQARAADGRGRWPPRRTRPAPSPRTWASTSASRVLRGAPARRRDACASRESSTRPSARWTRRGRATCPTDGARRIDAGDRAAASVDEKRGDAARAARAAGRSAGQGRATPAQGRRRA